LAPTWFAPGVTAGNGRLFAEGVFGIGATVAVAVRAETGFTVIPEALTPVPVAVAVAVVMVVVVVVVAALLVVVVAAVVDLVVEPPTSPLVIGPLELKAVVPTPVGPAALCRVVAG